jgi:hypothetical protein
MLKPSPPGRWVDIVNQAILQNPPEPLDIDIIIKEPGLI